MNSLVKTAKQLDNDDILKDHIQAFDIPDGLVYLDGNSLGPVSHRAKLEANEVVSEQWGKSLIKSWNEHDWIRLPQHISHKLAPLLGCKADDVACCDSISVNLFKLLGAAIKLNPKRNLIVTTSNNFPTDIYIVQGLQGLLGEDNCRLEVVEPNELTDFIDAHASEIAIAMLTHVDFRTGEFFDMKSITEQVHQAGALMLWDLAHSVGVLPLSLDECDVDFAVGCTYKYLNGGPGAPAFLFVNEKWQHKIQQPISGWMGHASPFEFTLDYAPAKGVQQFLSGTPPVVSMSILNASLSIFEEVEVDYLWQKSLALGNFFHECVVASGLDSSITLGIDLSKRNRNGQLAYTHEHAYEICQALIDHNVIGDYRAPNILRLGFSPLYLSFEKIVDAVSILKDIIENSKYLDDKYKVRSAVT